MHDRGQAAAAGVAAPGEVGVLGRQAREHAAQERPGALAVAGVLRHLERRARVQRRLVRPDVTAPPGPSGASPLRQNAGPGKYASSGTPAWKTMCGTRPSAHWPPRIDSSSCAARAWSIHAQPNAMYAASQPHWCGYWRRDGTVEAPVQLRASTASASARSVAIAPRRRRFGHQPPATTAPPDRAAARAPAAPPA